MTRGVSAIKGAVWVQVGTQYGSKFDSKGGEGFGLKVVGVLVHNKRLFVNKVEGSVSPSASVTALRYQNSQFLPRNTNAIP